MSKLRQRHRTYVGITVVLSMLGVLLVIQLPALTVSSQPKSGGQVFLPLLVHGTTNLAYVYLKEPMAFDNVVELADTYDVQIHQVEHLFTINDVTFTGMYRLTPTADGTTLAADAVLADWSNCYVSFLVDMSTTLEQATLWEAPATGDDTNTPPVTLSAADFRTTADTVKLGSTDASLFAVTAMIIEGNVNMLNALRTALPGISSFDINTTTPENTTSEQALITASATDGGEATQRTSATSASWVPKQGVVETGQSDKKYRYVTQSMYWNDVSGFGKNATYEHDFFLNNYEKSELGRGTYLSRSQFWPSAIPNVKYAASNLPSAYLDSRLDDPSYMIAYTIGSAAAQNITSGTWYYTYIKVAHGDADRDNAILRAQRGQRRPERCYSMWCSYGVESVDIISEWKIRVPGTQSWFK